MLKILLDNSFGSEMFNTAVATTIITWIGQFLREYFHCRKPCRSRLKRRRRQRASDR
jgi:uncharacterized membrane protein YGL010W